MDCGHPKMNRRHRNGSQRRQVHIAVHEIGLKRLTFVRQPGGRLGKATTVRGCVARIGSTLERRLVPPRIP